MNALEKSESELIEALEGIRVSLVSTQGKVGKTRMVVEEMDSTQSRIFSNLDMGKYLALN